MYADHAGTKIIANYLNDARIPTRKGDLWTYSTISNIITNPVYTGKIRRGWSRQIKSIENGEVKRRIKRLKNPHDYDTFAGRHQALISDELFERVQNIRLLKQPAVKVKKGMDLKNPFAGLIFCAVCGKRIGRTTSNAGVPRFRCVNHRNCHNASSNYDIVERQIIRALRVWFDGYKVKIDTGRFDDDIAAFRAKKQQLAREIDKRKQQMENAFNLVEQGVYTLELFKSRRAKLEDEIASLQHEQHQLCKALDKLETGAARQSSLIPQTEKLLESYDSMSSRERNDLLKEVLRRIEYRKEPDGKVEIDLFPKFPQL